MSERGARGGGSRGGQRGGGARGGRGGGRGGGAAGAGGSATQGPERPKREAILDLAKYVDQRVRVKFAGGRQVIGVLKGYDQLLNLVMDEVEEYINDPETGEPTEQTRALGLAVLRGTALTVINPADGFEQIANPFAQAE
ncbi:U6 snRNA-associated Sm-like protein LSm7 [Tilletiopsis washingtonensis]|uniref:U6 snRNA-associated Sm-like protein LSm7 n=1 Tax=Tilletiopsis washingtonensis TaxID=58919 RepID=A0A316ZH21_9BASI|nr:U6 snRNA-associated Sm-like protein LSm7 [Tilletiopsis washingtonensis]PWO01068.1 U6 snRNA-associated Sm-like protein LSm7 [Tilletiopsis washingtonensis]